MLRHQRSKVSGPQTNQTTSGGETPNRTFTVMPKAFIKKTVFELFGRGLLKKYTCIVVYSFFKPKMPWLFATFAELPSLTSRSPSPCPEAEEMKQDRQDSVVVKIR